MRFIKPKNNMDIITLSIYFIAKYQSKKESFVRYGAPYRIINLLGRLFVSRFLSSKFLKLQSRMKTKISYRGSVAG